MHLSCNDSVPPARPIHQFSCISSNSNQPNSLSRLPSAILFCFFTIPSHVCDATMPLFFSNLAVTVSFSSSFSVSFFLLLPPPLSRSGTFRLWCDGSVIHSSSLFTFFLFSSPCTDTTTIDLVNATWRAPHRHPTVPKRITRHMSKNLDKWKWNEMLKTEFQ